MSNPNYPQQPYGAYPPPEKKRVWLWLILSAVLLLCGFGGCTTIVANSDNASESFEEGHEDR